MSSGDHLPGSSVVVVAEVIRDDGTAANEVIVLVEQKTGPGELSRTCLSMSKTRCRPAEGSCAALLVTECGGLTASLSPGDGVLSLLGVDAGYSKYGQVYVIVIATRLLANRAAVLLSICVRVGHWSVDNSDGDVALQLILLGLCGGPSVWDQSGQNQRGHLCQEDPHTAH
eukprot:TRINITY_DN14679_c0_g1_i7.p1 TRINITY_DN14679_c0_g1~~TRINITY_DN14679_c0_g1_i7.p1  ORF type:complete len:171 (-),score=48.14 TRINITY_DN14679_c0_g1_i7:498-1010(-)